MPSRALLIAFALAAVGAAQEHVPFPTQDGGIVCADLYGKADRGVVLAHGGRFTKESWEKQARQLEAARGSRPAMTDTVTTYWLPFDICGSLVQKRSQ